MKVKKLTTKVWGLNNVLHFGKHKGCNLYSVIKFDVTYIKWALDNIKGFTLSKNATKLFNEHMTMRDMDHYGDFLNPHF